MREEKSNHTPFPLLTTLTISTHLFWLKSVAKSRKLLANVVPFLTVQIYPRHPGSRGKRNKPIKKRGGDHHHHNRHHHHSNHHCCNHHHYCFCVDHHILPISVSLNAGLVESFLLRYQPKLIIV